MEINKAEVAQKYNSLETIWSPLDKWHKRTFKTIQEFIAVYVSHLKNATGNILNAGSAGYSYGLSESKMIHLDIAEEKIQHLPNGRKGSIENIPASNEEFDMIVCVGSVINYCDPLKVFEEFDRVLKPGGHIVLEFENSNTLELIFTRDYNKKAVFVNTFYYGPEPLWYYSDNWIREIISMHKLKIERVFKFHLLSPFIYRFTKNENSAGVFIWFDKILKWIPVLRNISSNTILLIKKGDFTS